MIISASRRTDIPAFYGEWFMNRLRSGYCLAANPFNPAMVSRIPLTPDDVDVIVFWSKNPVPMFSYLAEIARMGFRYYFLFTLNHYPESLEPGMPPIDERIRTFRRLARDLGAARVVWRYDPVILSRELDTDYHLDAFERIAVALRGATKRVIVSCLDFYRKTERRLSRIEAKTGDTFCRDVLGSPGCERLMKGIAAMAVTNGMEIQSCAEDPRMQADGIKAGKCVDDGLIRRVFGINLPGRKDPGQRERCLCVTSRDIGAMNSCLHGCEYCYSTMSHGEAQARAEHHDPAAPFLIAPSY